MMKKLLKNNLIKTAGVSLSLLSLGVVGSLSINGEAKSEQLQPGNAFKIVEHGIRMQQVGNTTTNSDGSITKVYSYKVQPENATSKEVFIDTKFIDESDCSEYVTSNIDEQKQQVSITCYQAFNKVVNVKLTSQQYPDKSATIQVDYVKKLLDVPYKDYKVFQFCESENVGVNDEGIKPVTKITENDLIQTEYSIFTKDKEYTYKINYEKSKFALSLPIDLFKLDSINVPGSGYAGAGIGDIKTGAEDEDDVITDTTTEKDEWEDVSTSDLLKTSSSKMLYQQSDYWTPELKNLIVDSLKANKYPTAQQLWDVNNNNPSIKDDWHQYLNKGLNSSSSSHRLVADFNLSGPIAMVGKERETDYFAAVDLLTSVSCNEVEKKTESKKVKVLFRLPEKEYFSSLVTATTGILADSNVEF